MNMRTKTYYIITERGRNRFKKWLIDKNMSMSEFARKIGVSRSYVSKVILGQEHITAKVRELFKKGGYDLI